MLMESFKRSQSHLSDVLKGSYLHTIPAQGEASNASHRALRAYSVWPALIGMPGVLS